MNLINLFLCNLLVKYLTVWNIKPFAKDSCFPNSTGTCFCNIVLGDSIFDGLNLPEGFVLKQVFI